MGIIAENMLRCISNFHVLEYLTLSIWFGIPVPDENLLHDALSHGVPNLAHG